jgi:D-alanine-D-alanine ligase
VNVGLTFDLRPESGRKYVCGDDHGVEWDKESTIHKLAATIVELGHKVTLIGDVNKMLANVRCIRRLDIVFNVCEGAGAMSREGQVPAILDALGVPYTFADPLAMCMCLHKPTTKHMLIQGKIPTPNFVVVNSVDELNMLELPSFPVIVKPAHEGTSKGIDAKAIVDNKWDLEVRVKFVLETYNQCALVEEFINGDDVTVAILGTGSDAKIIGSAIIHLKDLQSKLYGIREKELCEELVEYEVGVPSAEIGEMALRAFKIMGCRDAGRVDFIISNEAKPVVLEVNPLPGLHPSHSDLPIIAHGMGLSYVQLIDAILNSALKRRRCTVNVMDYYLSSIVMGIN